MIRTTLFVLLAFSASCLFAQPPASEEDFEKAYQSRISKDVLYGVYIPEDLTDAFIQLNKLIDEDSKNKFKNMPEAAAAVKLHFSFGRWIMHNWGFYGGSRFTNYLNTLGVYDPDVMVKFVILTYHRNLNRKPLDVKMILDQYKAQKEEELAKENGKRKVVSEKTRKLSQEEIAKLKEKEKNKGNN
jgi:hypothetical protein